MQATIALPQIRGGSILTHSRIAAFKECNRRHFYSYELGVRKESDPAALRIGSAIHKGLEFHAKGEDDVISKAIAGYQEPPLWCNTEEKFMEWIAESRKVACMLSSYFWYWGESEIEEYVAVELEFNIPIRNPDTGAATNVFTVSGKIDGIVRMKDGRLLVLEHKTTSDDISPDADYWKRLRLDHQISLYMVAARELGHEVDGVLYNVLRKPRHDIRNIPVLDADGLKIVIDANGQRVMNKNGSPKQSPDAENGWIIETRLETADEYDDRLLAEMRDRPESYFARQEIPRLNADLEEFAYELWFTQQHMRECQIRNRWVRNTASCIGFGRCQYLDVCHNGMRIGEAIPSGFTRVENIHPELSGVVE